MTGVCVLGIDLLLLMISFILNLYFMGFFCWVTCIYVFDLFDFFCPSSNCFLLFLVKYLGNHLCLGRMPTPFNEAVKIWIFKKRYIKASSDVGFM